MDEALAVVTKNLVVEYGKIFELQPDGRSLLLRSGVGWKDGLVGRATIQLDSPAGCTLASGKPVMLEDLLSEAHFNEPQLLREHGVKSGVTVIIHGREWPFGVLGVDTTKQRTFTEDDVSFLQAVANVLATAIERRRSDEAAYQIKKHEASRTKDEAVERRFGYLEEVGKMLSSSLDYPTTLTSLARLAVPELADWCIVDMLEEEGAVRRSAVAHTDPAKEDLLCELLGRYPFNPDAPYGTAEVLRTGRAKIVPEVLDWMVAYLAHDTEHLKVLRELSIESYIGVPLLSRGRILGAITLVSSEPGCRYGPEDLALAENFAHCAALALDNARLHHPRGANCHQATAGHNRKARSPDEERRYSWLEDYLVRCKGKEARQEYYTRLEEEPAAPPV
jgi:GAF domain-containing protein